jgi:hypothetical protein
VRAGLVAAGDEARVAGGNALEGIHRLRQTLDPRGIVFGADDDEGVVHDEPAVPHLPFLDVLLLHRGGVRERHVGLSAPGEGERLAGAHGDGLHRHARLLLEHRHEHVEQARVLGARGGGEDHDARLGGGGCRHHEHHHQGREDTPHVRMAPSGSI